MINISAVSYLNTLPLIYGLNNSNFNYNINLSLDYPSICATKFKNGEVDIALVPVVIMNELKSFTIITDYCIGSNGNVNTVCLYSDVPINQVESIFLDYQSRTSIELLKILLKNYWKLKPNLISSKPGFENDISAKNAGLIIGDRCFLLNNKYKYVYDLSFYWKKMTGFPFVFAVWLVNSNLSSKFMQDFNNAVGLGLNNIDKILLKENNIKVNKNKLKDYLTNTISYKLDNHKINGMNFFLKMI